MNPHGLQEVVLAGGHRVACTHAAEVPLLARQVAPYFRHGIELASGDTVIDVGANIGLFCTAATRWGELPLRGLALEPVPKVHAALAANLGRFAPGIVALHCAAGRQEGELAFLYFPRATMLSTAHADELSAATTRHTVADQLQALPRVGHWLARWPRSWRRALVWLVMPLWLRGQRMTCPQRSLSGLIDEHRLERIDLLKIDAERAEWEVLQGLEPRHWPLVQQVAMEVHDIDGRLQQVLTLLQDSGFAEPVVRQSTGLRAFGIYQVWARRPPG